MPYEYEEKFKVLERFESNQYQNIMMGVANDNPDEVVVINQFKKSGLVNDEMIQLFKSQLSSLLSFEETEEEAVVITKYNEGMPLKNFLENYDTTLNSRINFAYEFLKKISIYNLFNHYFMSLFVDEDQIIMKNDELLLNELLVFNKTDDITTTSFNMVCQKIGLILDNIISSADDEVAKKSIQEFIDSLKNDQHSYKALDEIHNAFKKIYIYDMFLDKDQSEDSKVSGAVIAGGVAGAVVGGVIASSLNSEDNPVPPSDSPPANDNAEDDWESNLRSTFGRAPVDNHTFEDSDDKSENAEEDQNDSTSTPMVVPIVAPPLNIEKEVVSDIPEMPIEEPEDVTPEISSVSDTEINDSATENNIEADVSPTEPEVEEDELLSPEEEEQLQALFSNKEETTEVVVKEKKRTGCLWILLALLLLLLAIFGFNTMRKTFLSPKVKPVVSIVKTRVDDSYFFENKSVFSDDSALDSTEWKIFFNDELKEMADSEDFTITLDEDGKYVVELRVKDSNNVWSETEEYEFYHVAVSNENGENPENSIINVEKLDNYTIAYDSGQVTKDETIYRNGTYSFKMDFDADSSDKVFTIKDTFMDDNATISLWLRCSNTKPIELSFEGYNNQTVIFEKKLKHIPAVANQWRMVQFNVRVPKTVDSIKVTVSAESGTVWIDDFAINSFK